MSNQNKQENNNTTPASSHTRSQRIAAQIGVILLVLLYITTLVVAIVDTSKSGKLFALCLLATLALPLLIWIYTWLYGKITGRPTLTEFYVNKEEPENWQPSEPLVKPKSAQPSYRRKENKKK